MLLLSDGYIKGVTSSLTKGVLGVLRADRGKLVVVTFYDWK